MKDTTNDMGILKSLFWPLKKQEVPQVLSMFALIFFIIFNYVLLRVCKDTLIINAHAQGAAVIPFIKIWVVPPIAFLLMALEIKLFSMFDRLKVFIINLVFFIGFYFLFIYVLFPHLSIFEPSGLSDYLFAHMGPRFEPFVVMIQYWPIALFYVLAEMWSSVVLCFLFWGLANDITPLDDAKRYYGFLAVGANLAYFVAGFFINIVVARYSDFSSAENVHDLLHIVSFALLISAVLSLFFYMNILKHAKASTDIDFSKPRPLARTEKTGKPMGAWESLLYVLKNPYLRNLAIMVVGYGVTINLIEVSWKYQIRDYFPSTIECMDFMGKVQVHMSYMAIIFLLISGPMIRKWGWRPAALLCPLIILGTGVAFFSLVIFKNIPLGMLLSAGFSPLAISVWVGFWQNVLSKAAKNSIFNVTKELAFIPLDDETRIKGKAAIDILGERFGKFGGSFLCMILILTMGEVSSIAVPSSLFLILMTVWSTYATIQVGKKMQDL